MARPKNDEIAEVIPDIREIFPARATAMKIARLVEEQVNLSSQLSDINKRKAEISEELKIFIAPKGAIKMMVLGNYLNYYASTKSTIDKTRLLVLGVQPSVVKAATITKEFFSLKITPPGESDEPES